MFCVALPKAAPGEPWSCLFRGDSDGARCLQPPYSLTGAMSALPRGVARSLAAGACKHAVLRAPWPDHGMHMG